MVGQVEARPDPAPGPPELLSALLEPFGLQVPLPAADPGCPVLAFAASGAMWLTGHRGGPPVALAAPLWGHLDALAGALQGLGAQLGHPLEVDPRRELTARAKARGLRRSGRTSANGSCRLFMADDAWVALNLARPTDLELVPALTEVAGARRWADVETWARRHPGGEVVDRARLLGLAVAALCEVPRGAGSPVPFVVERLGEGRPDRPVRPVVVDCSAMWAGPLCASLLGRAGAFVTKVEDPERPDGARLGDPALFARLHAGHDLAQLRLSTASGRHRLHELIADADVVIESSRPRALEQLGISPRRFLEGAAGRTWVSVTGHGRRGDGADRVAFGDDAAVAGGLVGWGSAPPPQGPGGDPVFCADAVADPISGLYAALGALASVASGGGHLVEVSMSAASAYVLRGSRCGADHRLERQGRVGWSVSHGGVARRVARPS